MTRPVDGPLRPGGRTPTQFVHVGDTVGPYRLCFELARGGMASVFLARVDGRAGMHRFVALKCIRPELADDDKFIDMFIDEAWIASQVQHANVCSVFDFDEYRGTHYIAMEYLRGEPLSNARAALESPPAHWDSLQHAGVVARVIADAAEGLHAVHELRSAAGHPLRVVHRDVSPENLFVTYDGNVKIIDFGVATASDQRHKTLAGIVKGKYGYIQPEVLQGAKQDRRSDVWSLGVVAWELLTHARLFDGDSELDRLRAVSGKPIPPPSQLRDGIPAALDDIVLRALQRDPPRRFQTAREFGRHLTRFSCEHRLPIGLAEVADWMDQLFPAGRACKRQLLHMADQLDRAVPALAEPEGADERRTSRFTPISLPHSFGEASPIASAALEPLPASTFLSLRPRFPWRRVGYALLAVAAVLAALHLVSGVGNGTARAASVPAPTAAATGSTAPGPTRFADTANEYLLELSPVAGGEPGTALLQVRLVPR